MLVGSGRRRSEVVMLVEVLVATLIAAPGAQPRTTTGAYLQDQCTRGENLRDGVGGASIPNLISLGWCTGYITGVGEAMAEPGICIPPEVVAGQVKSVVTKWLKDHPESLHLGADECVIQALRQGFPCSR
jgi:hypothetical protein